jgi:hypothetical protein
MSLKRCFSFIFHAKWSHEGVALMCPYMAICPYMGTHGFRWHSPTLNAVDLRARHIPLSTLWGGEGRGEGGPEPFSPHPNPLPELTVGHTCTRGKRLGDAGTRRKAIR